ncbi:Histone-fold-containing protein [Pyrenophora tritici-repentis]|nr:Histone-fold-containing protein [Pyrenophora tritici-repentis]KAI0577296.1 Histone-fold-containing protein [Pyrenophora tritici-repentis]KAI0607406.1 Histone-fold-containing protein [Pyrenophora tritici-repentis]PZC92916.1 HAP5, CCAAT-binding factor, subunit C [Pyrenophora tritici-repentis]PZD24421.1 HAP5, CCAAT-binding factor, subunit C [Pyrenophora tritici-repentis]
MPYNNTPIAPNKEITGHVSLPLARVQKIIQADPERITTSKNAAFAIALATEMFIQHLATTTHNVVKAERKPRRNIQYRDVSSAIAKTDNLEFLDGKKAGKGKTQTTLDGTGAGEEATEMEEDGDGSGEKGGDEDTVVTVSASASASPPHQDQNSTEKAASTPAPEPSDEMDVDQPAPSAKQVEDSEPEEDAAAMQIEMEMRGPPRHPTKSASPRQTRRSTGFTAINGSK